ncbi:MAG: M1 family metallopeptidase [Taibaiella sp.]|nr:M1 family metallopeptidase [Taibaiella sp.]
MKKYVIAAGVITLAFLAACNNNKKVTSSTTQVIKDTIEKDIHTLSNADSIKVTHLDLDIQVSFDKKQISGSATWTISNTNKLGELRLDTYDLTIDSVLVDGQPTNYRKDAQIPNLGSALHIPITADATLVRIVYKTGANARALQWLDPQQTLSRQHPFLYTQSESIYARSWIPCPDGPALRYTYNARVTVPKGLMALMSAENPQQVSDSGIYHFKMEIPVPAYLMALAVGDIAFRSIDQRTGVYAEQGMIDKARYEFEDVGKMVSAAEKLYGPYRWGRYDVLVLPPGFPIGGMENPRLTFCTPTVIAGDRSLVSLIAHELAHSWSGNLVTNATWDDFWLNEGFTVYFERRIMESMYGKSYSDMLWELGYQDLVTEVDGLGKESKDTWLKLDLKDRDPDAGLTDIPYEKGAHFLKLIETNVGRDTFDAFLNKYFNDHAFSTVNTEQFVRYLNANLIKDNSTLEENIGIKQWVYGPGIPANCPRTYPERFKKVDAERMRFTNGTPAAQIDTTGWTTNEWLQFLRGMPKPMVVQQMQQLDDAFHFTQSGNSEIADLWYIMAVTADYQPAYPAIDLFLSTVGRRKFLEPLYSAMIKTGKAAMAKTMYKKYRQNYHPLAQESLDKIIK